MLDPSRRVDLEKKILSKRIPRSTKWSEIFTLVRIDNELSPFRSPPNTRPVQVTRTK